MERDKFMSPMDAKEFGIIDKVLEHPMQENDEKSESVSSAGGDSGITV